jgi:murein DD-endopeptidase MepM/ murein hydrolase activator NlpD
MKKPFTGCVYKASPEGSVTQWFGENPKLYAHMNMKGHNGIDLVAPWDTPLLAVEDGTVVAVKREPGGYGRHVRFVTTPKNGVCNEWVYGHCEQLFVEVGDKITTGQKIATMGNTGFVVSDSYANTFWGTSPKNTHPGTHLHLGLRKVVRSVKGWVYAGTRIRVENLSYDNGYKGSIDPIPELTGKTQDSLREKQLETIGVLKTLVSLYQQLLKTK